MTLSNYHQTGILVLSKTFCLCITLLSCRMFVEFINHDLKELALNQHFKNRHELALNFSNVAMSFFCSVLTGYCACQGLYWDIHHIYKSTFVLPTIRANTGNKEVLQSETCNQAETKPHHLIYPLVQHGHTEYFRRAILLKTLNFRAILPNFTCETNENLPKMFICHTSCGINWISYTEFGEENSVWTI